ncbi:MAG: 30S ribosome-binding factor RbfA [Prevotellaceae bacterium]|jgi:ribosome-binding factor A|nr:30S ribosome-binding factor RbfA [Prevotellaceae bacterium]
MMEQQESTRQLKVGRQLQRDLAEILRQQGMSAYHGAMITVTSVRVSPDLALARVRISIFPSNQALEVLQLLQKQVKTIRGELGRRVAKQLRIVPELVFQLDDSLDYAERIDQLLTQ